MTENTFVTLDSNRDIKSSTTRPLPAVVQEILIFPSEGICMPLTAAQADELEEKSAEMDAAINKLNEAKASKDQDKIKEAAKELNITISMVGGGKSETMAASEVEKTTTPLVLNEGAQTGLKEAIALAKEKCRMLPQSLIDKFKKEEGKGKNWIPLAEESETVDENDAFKRWRDEKGGLKKEVIIQNLKEAILKFSVDWKLVDKNKNNGQIDSKIVAGVLCPGLQAILKDENFEAIDAWVGNFNKNAKVSWNKKEEERKEILALLDKKDGFTLFDAEFVRRSVKDIWGEQEDEHGEFTQKMMTSYPSRYLEKEPVERKKMAADLKAQPLPPVMWDASMGAQLMRYSMGVTAKAEMDLMQGKLSVNLDGQADFCLAEGKAELNQYLPNDQGYNMKFDVRSKKETKEWVDPKLGDNNAHFFFDNSLFLPSGIFALCLNLKENQLMDPFDKVDSKIQLVGHTDAMGENNYNDTLSQARAESAYGFLQKNVATWLKQFKEKTWGETEVLYMYAAIWLHDKNKFTFHRWFVERSPKGTMDEFLKELSREGLLDGMPEGLKETFKGWSQGAYTPTHLEMGLKQYFPKDYSYLFANDPNSGKIEYDLRRLISAYFRTMTAYSVKKQKCQTQMGNLFCSDDFYSKPLLSRGETELLKNTQDREVVNRRVEFVFHRLVGGTEEVKVAINLGYMRMLTKGAIGAWVGANLALGVGIDLEVHKGILMMTGTREEEADEANTDTTEQSTANGPKASAGAKASAFAGAKAVASLISALEWKAPEKAATFKMLGSVGYTVTGMAGAGIEGEFKIGFDKFSKRFQIKMKAKAALGVGFGGAVAFSVGVVDLWNFVTMVHEKLSEVDFNYLDIFETGKNSDGSQDESQINVYKLFNAWSLELFKKGKVLTAGVTYAYTEALEGAIKILHKYDNLIGEWEKEKQELNKLDTLVQKLNQSPEMIGYLTPETKGRILYLLTQYRTKWYQDFFPGNGITYDRNYDYENAALMVIKKGVKSRRDWQETLEHMAQYNEQSKVFDPYNATQKKSFQPENAKALAEKEKRMEQNKTWLNKKLLYEPEKWFEVRKHINNLSK
ncbi:hypothetical protein DMA11_23305 [Marinilabiliaceae bacterium JC017]|nr:hypothetical protein DMA11_23305 [Marinilabiliaceae bacterium JC017]